MKQLTQQFVDKYGQNGSEIRVFHAPGRVNLIGEHTDYNGGYVFPAALTFGTWLVIRPREDMTLRFASTNFELTGEVSLENIHYDEKDDWMNYPKGIVEQLQNAGYGVSTGYDFLYHGEIPNGSGLSSSASIEVVTAYALLTLEGHPTDRTEIALLSQKAENQFMGVQCGIMDQFAVAQGKADHAILLMCDTLEYDLVPFESGDYRLIVSNTNKRRGLVDSKYNERRSQCEAAVKALNAELPNLTLLGQLSKEQFDQHQHLIEDVNVRKRAKHVVEEIDRVKRSVEALKAGQLKSFGDLMNESHVSLRDLYEVSCRELDVLVEQAWNIDGVLGSRMTGAGFGGCTISLVHQDAVNGFIEQVGKVYQEETGLTADFYVCGIGDGVKEMKEG
ncbi:galactokinase [Marinicrinis lubricantis]|uniref:Galactokinase n=1 Tax=Marinicrinis lubricantis TaxID=2086470 RepID=A0ABW1IVW6_9BACL